MSSSIIWADVERDVIHVEGHDSPQFLHSQLANDISNMPIGATVHSLLLEPTGHLVSLVRVVRTGDETFIIDTEKECGDVVIARLSKFILRAKVTFSRSSQVVRAFRGKDAREVVGGSHDSQSLITAQPWWDDPNAIDVIGEATDLPAVGTLADPSQLEIARVEAGWPRMNVDVVAGDVPATTGVLSLAVSFTKGCYPGQELVERMDSRGTIAPIVLRVFSSHDGAQIEGDVTSQGSHHVLARVKRSSLGGDEITSLWR